MVAMGTGNNFTVECFILIHATASKIWDVLTNPEKIKTYLYGSNVITDWKIGSEVLFTRDRLHPKAPISENLIVDRGKILDIEKEKLLNFSFFSCMEGYPDLPENYSVVSYRLSKVGGNSVRLDYRRTNIPIEIEKINQEKFMPGMMDKIKMLAEGS
jgi:uncharacterized protein YndB with AHSA1/START domain